MSVHVKPLLLDGGLASQLAAQGNSDIDADPLWSARLLYTNPSEVLRAHEEYLEAGAEIITTNTYQVSISGFKEFLGLEESQTLQIIKDSVLKLARPAAEKYSLTTGIQRYVAGSVGPYGACLHNGSEYTGDYVDEITTQELIDWHRPRIQALMEAGVDYLAVETIPALKECQALMRLLETEFPQCKAWLTVACKDGLHTNHGELFSDVIQQFSKSPVLSYIGINCTSPLHVNSLLDSCSQDNTTPYVVYANSGMSWTSCQGWDGKNQLSISTYITDCIRRNVEVIGGCCQVNADTINKIREIIDTL